jgi:hypothetical protein
VLEYEKTVESEAADSFFSGFPMFFVWLVVSSDERAVSLLRDAESNIVTPNFLLSARSLLMKGHFNVFKPSASGSRAWISASVPQFLVKSADRLSLLGAQNFEVSPPSPEILSSCVSIHHHHPLLSIIIYPRHHLHFDGPSMPFSFFLC